MAGETYTPPNLDAAVSWQLRCVRWQAELARSVDEATFIYEAWPRGNPSGWLSTRDSALRQWFVWRGIDFRNTDSMYGILLAGVWHKANGRAFDADAKIRCTRVRDEVSKPPTLRSPIYDVLPGFNCLTDAEVETGRRVWSAFQ